MNNPLPLLLTLMVGGLLMSRSGSKSNPIESDELPRTLDYDDPELHDLLEAADEDEDDEDEDEEENEDELPG